MRNLLVAAVCSVVLLLGRPAEAMEWVYRLGVLSVLDPSTSDAVGSAQVGRVDAMSSDGSGGLWYATPDALALRDRTGASQLRVTLDRLGPIGGIDSIAPDPHADEAWVTDGSRLLAIGTDGIVRVRRLLPARPVAMAVAQDQHLWLLEKGRLLRLSREGSLVSMHELRSALQSEARHLALDDIAGHVWIVGSRRGVALDLNGKVRGRFSLSEPSLGSCVVSGHEGLWVLTASGLERRAAEGALVSRIEWMPLGLPRPVGLVCNWLRQEVWVIHEAGIARLDIAGSIVGSIGRRAPARVEPVAFHVRPAIRLVQPPQDALTSDPRPTIEVGLAATCPAVQCPPLDAYLAGLRLEARFDSNPIGLQFTRNPASGSATFRPDAALADGMHRLIARARDPFGHASPRLEAAFTVDTVAPAFLAVTPADGTMIDAAQTTIAGAVDDPHATVVLENQAAIGGRALPADAGQFAFSVPLRPGSNRFVLSAIDRAGNVTHRDVRIERVSGEIGVVVADPPDGATVQADAVIVRGTVDSGGQRIGVSVNGEPAALIGNTFHAQVALQPGVNLLQVSVASAGGGTFTETLTVTRQGERSFRPRVWSAAGIAPHSVSFAVDQQGSRAMANWRIDYQGDGSVDFSSTDPSIQPQFTYQVPGVYAARVTVTDTLGQQETHDLQVVVQDLAVLDQELRAVLGTMLVDLRSGNLDAALNAFSESVRPRYRSLFERAGSGIAAAVDSLGTVQDGGIVGSMAEYVIVQDRPAGPKACFVYLTRARDGLWRIQQM